jgi:zinc protease
MGSFAALLLCSPLVAMTLGAQGIQLPDVVEKTLANHMKVLLVERAGAAVHVQVFLQGGRANTGGLPPAAADLLARSLFTRLVPEETESHLKAALGQEGGAFEAMRLEALRQARLPGSAPSPEFQNLKLIHDEALATIVDRIRPLEAWDALDALGATHRETIVEADFLSHGLDLPAGALPAWCQLEAGRLKRLPLGRFPLERDRLAREIEAGDPPSPSALSFLLATALSGHPYAQAGDFQRSRVEALTWEDLLAFAKAVVVPDQLTLVIVGDVQRAALLPVLERSFGTIGKTRGAAAGKEGLFRFNLDDPMGSQDSPGGRRLTVSTLGQPRLFLSWQVPPANHPDGPALRAMAQVLGGSPSSRLQNLTGPRGLAKRLTLDLGVPGERDGNLLVIEAEPAEGRSLEELEQAIQGEILRLGREPLPESEVHRAQVQMEAGQLFLQEDAGALARALGAAHCQGGDWRLAFRALEMGRDMKPGEIQGAARTYLVPARSTIAQLGPDPLLMPMDRTETRLLQVLTALVRRKLGGEAQAQTVLREAMRQMRMLSSADREKTLKLLEAQVRP